MNQDFFSIKVLYFIKKERVSERGITKDLENINYVLHIHKYSVFLHKYQMTEKQWCQSNRNSNKVGCVE